MSVALDHECPAHAAPVDTVNTHEWRVRCPQCPYGRWHGQDKDGATAAQTRHMRAWPTHLPSVAYDKVTDDGLGTVLRWDNARRKRGTLRGYVQKPNGPDGPAPF